jgi:hypothetical protein
VVRPPGLTMTSAVLTELPFMTAMSGSVVGSADCALLSKACVLRVGVEESLQKSRPNKVHCVASHALSFSVVTVSDSAGFDRRTLNCVAALTFDRVGAAETQRPLSPGYSAAMPSACNRTRAIGRPDRIRPFFHSR